MQINNKIIIMNKKMNYIKIIKIKFILLKVQNK